jgi:hypothetical protein
MPSFNISAATAYLANTLYNSTLNLCREDNGAFSGRFWTASDNMLAFRAFALAGNSTLSNAIYNRLHGITINCTCIPPNGHDGSLNHQHDVVVWSGPPAVTIYDPPRVKNCWSVTGSSASQVPCPPDTTTSGTFHEDHCTGSSISNYASTATGCGYADLCFLEAINYNNQGNSSKAQSLYGIGHNKWDGNGYNDSAHVCNTFGQTPYNKYATFKLALDMIASWKVYGTQPNNFSTLDGKIAAQQDATTGGVHSSYTASQNQVGSANCETTSLGIIAYKLLGY